MIAAIALALLAVEDPAAPVPPPAASSAPLEQAQDQYDRAQQIYTQTCGDRAYGAYDDLCDQLKTQVHQYRVDLDRAQRTAAQTPARTVSQPKP